jgi:DNA-binding response OmpR family regulator
MDKKRVLIVEDDETIANLERAVLEVEGFEVEIARDGVEGLEMVKSNGYDVIISDFTMPKMMGDEFYLKVKELNQSLAKRIIFVTSTINDFMRSTGNRILEKPFSNQHLVQTVKEYLTSPKGQSESDSIDLMYFFLGAKEAIIGKAIQEFSFKPPRIEMVEERPDLIKAYVSTSEGGEFPVMISQRNQFCGCRNSFQKGETCKHVLVLVFYLIRERNA